MVWSRIKIRGFHPSPRAGSCGVLCGTKWYIAGGGSRKKRMPYELRSIVRIFWPFSFIWSLKKHVDLSLMLQPWIDWTCCALLYYVRFDARSSFCSSFCSPLIDLQGSSCLWYPCFHIIPSWIDNPDLSLLGCSCHMFQCFLFFSWLVLYTKSRNGSKLWSIVMISTI